MNENIKALQACLDAGELSGKDAAFARDLISAFTKYKCLTAKQTPWVTTLLHRAKGTSPAGEQLGGRVKRIFELFRTAKENGLKYPRIRLETSEDLPEDRQYVVLTQAGHQSQYLGQVIVTDGGPFGDNKFFGRINGDGELTAGRDINEGVRKLLADLAAQPERTAAIYGLRTGQCCFCAKRLDDERSLAVGYGPQCAKKFSLGWGVLKVSTALELKLETA